MKTMEPSANAEQLNEDFIAGIFSSPTDGEVMPPDQERSVELAGLPEIHTSHLPSHLIRGAANRWDPRLILDLALAIEPLEEILPRYELSIDEFDLLAKTPVFRKELALMIREVREEGLSFSRKAQFQAESYLEVLDSMVYSELTPANIRLEAIRSTVKWGNLEKSDKEDGIAGGTINVQINF